MKNALYFLRNVIIAGIAISLIYSLSKNIFSYKDKLAFYHEYRKEYEEEIEQNKQLKSELKRSTDYYYIEKQIREKLNLLQDDEVAIILPEPKLSPSPTPTPYKKMYEQWIDLIVY